MANVETAIARVSIDGTLADQFLLVCYYIIIILERVRVSIDGTLADQFLQTNRLDLNYKYPSGVSIDGTLADQFLHTKTELRLSRIIPSIWFQSTARWQINSYLEDLF